MLPPALHRHHSFPGMSLLLGLLTTAWLLPVLPSAHAADRPVDYSRQIRPLLSDLCFKCHGPDAATRAAARLLPFTEARRSHPRSAAANSHAG